jgi:hypothetical protein
MVELYLHFRIWLHGIELHDIIKYRDNFTFYLSGTQKLWLWVILRLIIVGSLFISTRNTEQNVLGRTTFLWYDTNRTENDVFNNSSLRGNVFTELLPSNDRGIHRQTHRHMHPTTLLLLRVFVAPGTCLPSRYPVKKGGIHTDWWEIFMKCAVEMGSGAMIYIPSFIKIGSGIQKLIRGNSQTAWGPYKPTLYSVYISVLDACA